MAVPPSHFGRRPSGVGASRRFGLPEPVLGQRAPKPVLPPPVLASAPGPTRPPLLPPPVIAAPSAPPPLATGYGPPGNPLHPPAAPMPSAHATDRRTHAPAAPEVPGWPDAAVETATWDLPGEAAPVVVDGPTAFDVWQDLLTGYLETRNVGVSADGEAFPETTAGDVRRVAARLSRELCHPRYDLAGLVDTRAAWRDALARADALCTRAGWLEVYPENERFWLSDSLALAQRLAAVDARRNAIVLGDGGLLQVLGDRRDPLTTWQDLWHFFRARRPVRSDDRGWKYPETTIGDVVQIAAVLDDDVTCTLDRTLPLAVATSALRGRLAQWRATTRALAAHAAARPPDEPYPENAAFWRAARRLAIWLSVARDHARGGAAPAESGR